jgi:hypothetical protein
MSTAAIAIVAVPFMYSPESRHLGRLAAPRASAALARKSPRHPSTITTRSSETCQTWHDCGGELPVRRGTGIALDRHTMASNQTPAFNQIPRPTEYTLPTSDEDLRDRRLSRIAQRAFDLYEARGSEAGQDLADWLQAEREIDAEIEKDDVIDGLDRDA